MRTTLLGGLLDAARHNLARGAERVALFESGRAYLRDGEPVGGGTARRQLPRQPPGARRTSRSGSPASRSAPLPGAGWRGDDARAATSTRSRACSRARGRPRLLESRSRPPTSRSCTRAAPAAVVRRRRAGRLGRRAPPAGLPRLGPRRGGRRSSSTWRRWSTPRPIGGEQLRGRDHLPGGRPGPRRRRRRGGRGGAGARGRRRGRRRAAALGRRSSTSTAASRSARGARASRCGSSSAPPTGRSPTRRSRAVRERIEAALAEQLGGSLRG